jgi:predicted HTH domain antitoxin
MTSTLPRNVEILAGAWREFQTRVPVKIGVVEDNRHYGEIVDFLNSLLDEVGDRETHPLAGLLDLVAFYVRDYEDRVGEMGPPLCGRGRRNAGEPGAPGRSLYDTSPNYIASETSGNMRLAPRLALPWRGGYADIMKRVEIELPDETFAGLDRESDELAAELRAAAAVKRYELGRVSQEVAAQIAGVSRSEFITVLSRFKVSPMQESAEEALAGAQVLLQS